MFKDGLHVAKKIEIFVSNLLSIKLLKIIINELRISCI